MMQNSAKKILFGMAMAIACVAAIAFTAGQLNVQAQEPVTGIVVGTYAPQTAFEHHPAQARLMEVTQTLQTELHQAQQEGDAARVQQIQQQYEQEHTRAVEHFQRDVNQAVPAAAETAGVNVVALDIVYATPDVQTRDITQQLVEVFEELPEQPEAAPPGALEMPLPQQ